MKKPVALIVVLTMLAMTCISCGDNKKIDGTTYSTYGIINKSEMYNPDIKYRIVMGNVVWSIILCSTLIAPVYFIGFSIYEPIKKASENDVKGSVVE